MSKMIVWPSGEISTDIHVPSSVVNSIFLSGLRGSESCLTFCPVIGPQGTIPITRSRATIRSIQRSHELLIRLQFTRITPPFLFFYFVTRWAIGCFSLGPQQGPRPLHRRNPWSPYEL